ncbi:helicase-exonuclease AddAB subunit AddA [Streptococcus loxodontisalivarius]|uniref:ATP-dependent helicase/nuclease subunit A n=1 Tax=Streptococcus loxodontisalivarius TaxID=1349415 RepID=A0ABS2PTS8_9STRE|nr:helicase-exonuclease AddAB subunit AddA [Streptococcus loxodontisalivarius]MBM7643415.1 ATP-dependent helicase/nuclease subunit A [Streptococcus loxodontisalivarius]
MTNKPFLSQSQIEDLIAAEAASDKTQKLTAEQIEAIYSSGTNILVSASAGSGKTFVMVRRILDQIARGIAIDRLFISTFTVKAAGELRERLEKGLAERLSQAETTEEQAFLAEQMALLPTADIGTMDAFTQKLVNQYGYLLGISPLFRIMQDKSEQDILKNEVYADLFADYMSGKDQKDFSALVRNFAGNRKDSQSFRGLVYKVHSFAQSTANPDQWIRENFLKGHEELTGFAQVPDQMVETFLDCLENTAYQLRDLTESPDYSQTTKAGKPTAAYTKHLKIIQSLLEWSDGFKEVYGKEGLGRLAVDVTSVIPSGSDITVNKIKYPIFKQLQEQLVGLRHLETIFAYQGQALPLLKVMRNFVTDFSDQYLQAKIQENAFEFSDIAHLAIRILEENPQVAQHFQEKYHEVMVDEYQDNNHMQERMLELLSNGHNRFMVGDIKQSIYRFRQADPQIFNSKFKTYQEDPSQGKLILLKENFRSQSEVIDATNGVFSHLMDEQVGDILYNKTHFLLAGSPKQKEAHPENKTKVWIYNSDDEELDMETEEETSLSRGEVDLLAKEIIRLHKEEGVAFSDIALLVSSRSRNEALLTAFSGYGIPLVSDGGEQNYLKSLEVMIMLDTLRSINNPLNDYALVALLRSPMFQFDEDDLTRLALQADQTELYDKLCYLSRGNGKAPELVTENLRDKVADFLQVLDSWRLYAKSHSLYDLIWKIYNDRFYYDYVASLPNAQQRQANLFALALRANNYEKTGFKGLPRFIRMIDKILETQNDLADVEVALPKNAVQLMTIHKSKGLEFKYVFVLNIDKKFSMDDLRSPIILSRERGLGIKYLADMKDQFETDFPRVQVSLDTLPYQLNKRELNLATLSEQMRLLYVAMTRAEKRLYLIGKGSKDKLTDKYGTETENGFLPASSREQMLSFQDWLLALDAAIATKDLAFELSFVDKAELTKEAIGSLQEEGRVQADDLSHNRQSEAIRRSLDVLESVDKLNQTYQAAIDLPSLRTPSQVKHFYQPLMDMEGIDLMDKEQEVDQLEVKKTQVDFKLPDFSKSTKVSGAAVGSATHELMQRLVLSEEVSLEDISSALSQVQAEEAVKARIDLTKIAAFFETDLGQLITGNLDKLHREAPFAMLAKDPVSQEDFVVRGIVDGYLIFPDRIVLFDYKTDKFTDPEEIAQRYQGQMGLYAQSLRQAYAIEKVEKHLILLGGKDLKVLKI